MRCGGGWRRALSQVLRRRLNAAPPLPVFGFRCLDPAWRRDMTLHHLHGDALPLNDELCPYSEPRGIRGLWLHDYVVTRAIGKYIGGMGTAERV